MYWRKQGSNHAFTWGRAFQAEGIGNTWCVKDQWVPLMAWQMYHSVKGSLVILVDHCTDLSFIQSEMEGPARLWAEEQPVLTSMFKGPPWLLFWEWVLGGQGRRKKGWSGGHFSDPDKRWGFHFFDSNFDDEKRLDSAWILNMEPHCRPTQPLDWLRPGEKKTSL